MREAGRPTMRATMLMARQLGTSHQILHDVANDLTPEELTTRILPGTNLLGFDLWHVARVQDWAVQTMARGVPELIDEARWQGRGRLATHGIGVGVSEAEADELARNVALADILEYADALHQNTLAWLDTLPDEALDEQLDVPARLGRYPVYLGEAMRKEVPWMYQQPPIWRCISP